MKWLTFPLQKKLETTEIEKLSVSDLIETRRIHKQLQVNRNELHSPFGSGVSCHAEKTQTNEHLI